MPSPVGLGAAYPAAGAMPYQLDQVKAFKAGGGDVVISFGGAAGKELATVCTEDQLATGRMGDYALQAATALHDQLQALHPGLTDAPRWRMVGVTPMAGVNDNPLEVSTLADAQKVTAFAGDKHIGMLGLWSLGRDTPGHEFTKTLGAFTG
ncbi:hypothetical protein [Solirubrobacter soli]|uniref:hypothetical protein n=1 Tax=Solirubrobacter soli TaxID=363832 RepID=UPI00047FD9EA|nr:hypothetical protein [Solirubrobacter soli]